MGNQYNEQNCDVRRKFTINKLKNNETTPVGFYYKRSLWGQTFTYSLTGEYK